MFMTNKNDRIAKLREFNELCRLRQLNESVNDLSGNEMITIDYNGKLMSVPKWAINK